MGREPGAASAVQLAAELARREREVAALRAITGATGRGEAQAALLAEVDRHLRAVLPAGSLTVLTLDEDAVTLLALPDWGRPQRLRRGVLHGSPLSALLRERRTLHLKGMPFDLDAGAGAAFAPDAAWLATPLLAGDRLLGILLAGAGAGDAFDEGHHRLLEHAALHVAAALDQARLREETHRHVRQIETLREVVESISSELDGERLLGRIVGAAVDLLRAYGGAVGLVRPDGASLELRAVVNIPEEVGMVIPAGMGVMGEALRAGGAVVLREYGDAPEPLPNAALYHLSPWIAAPIFWQGRITGVFGICGADAERRFGDDDAQVLSLFAKHAAVAIENARLYEQGRALAITEERNRLAREIHDTLAQSLTGIVLQAQALEELVGRDAAAARAELHSLGGLARSALEEARRSVWGLRPPVLEGASLAEALATLTGETATAAGLTGRFTTSGRLRPLAPAIEAGLYRIAQEALTNVRRHAGARLVAVQLRFESGEIGLIVQDDGYGLEEAAGPGEGGGFGLTSMAERAHLLGGRLGLESAPGQGVRIEVRVPYLASALGGEARAAAGGGVENWPVRVLVADDHEVVRHGIVRVLESQPDIVVVAEAADGAAALARARQLRPDIVLIDIQMPGLSGIDVIAQMGREGLPSRAIILTTYARDDVIVEGIRAGAQGFLLKEISADELARAIRAVNAGESLLQPVVATRLLEQIGRMGRPATEREALTSRERDVLTLLVEGARNKEIGARLGISHGTVRFHVGNIFQKLGVSSRTEAVRLALHEGLVDTG